MHRQLLSAAVVAILVMSFLPGTAQTVKARFNDNDVNAPCHQEAFLVEKDKAKRIKLDTAFNDLQVTINLTSSELEQAAVKDNIKAIAGAYQQLAKQLGKDRVVTILDYSQTKFSWVYIYYVLRDCR